jgi:hypothetical protein
VGGLPPITEEEKEHMGIVLIDELDDGVLEAGWGYRRLQ